MATLAGPFDALVDRTGTHHLGSEPPTKHGIPQMRVDGRLTTARRVPGSFTADRSLPAPRPMLALMRHAACASNTSPSRRHALRRRPRRASADIAVKGR